MLEIGINPQTLYERFYMHNPLTISACTELEHIFAPLYDTKMAAFQLPLLKLKIIELLLYLSSFKPVSDEIKPCLSRHSKLIEKIHQQLTENLSQRFTIEYLSKQYLIDTSTLKEVFKYVYGRPIAAYMK